MRFAMHCSALLPVMLCFVRQAMLGFRAQATPLVFLSLISTTAPLSFPSVENGM